MKRNWPLKSVEEISERVAMGPFGSSIKVSTFVDKGIPVISGQHLKESRLVDGETNFITEEHARKLEKANVFPGDVIFTHAGNIGQVAYIPDSARYKRYVISQRQFYCRPDSNKVLPQWITAYFRSPDGRHSLLSNASSTGVPSIARPVTHLRSIKIPVPPLTEQERITSILEAIEEKIELNYQVARTLEESAQRQFKSWFVDFDPVRAKMIGRQPAHVPPETAALFPEKLVDSALGPIPQGWEIVDFSDEFDFTMGQSPPGSTYNESGEGAPFFQGKTDFGSFFPLNRVYCTAPTRGASELDTLFSVRAPVGAMNLALGACAIGRGLCAIRHRCQSPGITWFWVKEIADHIEGLSGEGALFKSLSKKQLKEVPVIHKPPDLINAAAPIFDEFIEKLRQLELETRTLTELRDRLLPKLISGEIRVSKAQEIAEEA